jgi:hypothetical protein
MLTDLLKKHGQADGTAEEFILAAIHLSKVCTDSKFIAPTIVCFSFAIELHIKAILASCNINPNNEHNLHKLYQKLPISKKNWILKMYSQIVGDIEEEKFLDEIKKWSNVFIEIRYYHDCTKNDQAYFDFSNFIPNLAIAINNAYFHTQKHERFSFPQLRV